MNDYIRGMCPKVHVTATTVNNKKKEFVLLLIGLSGSGKGTQSFFLKKAISRLRIIRTGPLLRKLAKKNTTTAKLLRPYLSQGRLVPEWVVLYTWTKVLFESVRDKESLLFDGTPRHITQARHLDEVMRWHGKPLPTAIFLDIRREESERRLLERGRADDTKEAIRERMKFFYSNVLPAIRHYKKQGRLIHVDGEQPPKKVAEDIRKELGL
ncbi:MAG: hypothetical protein A2934_01485 [Candidatus Sungbacteria bacterium RIFCSPLOWO2_01_FULL_47_10]|uniref:Adenylate kinase n=1 Tax=Candidatus Sungbacteria bacterium RIFCSPLOWO2_01_FULL_47_10 TaxID=1802276 RepID=A0A1G2L804_9BACT|nr:MAG: hypothetical protein A2934_01485 [Candidatus Sungbacteria bacterium RIFCSPLOWO2_01_FULL_47_10]